MKWKTPGTVSSLLALTILTLACLVPFLGKPFHIDDPLFVWCAKQIQAHPLEFYSFTVNWEGEAAPMAAVTQNPPLASYYMAPAGALAGWSEWAIHAWFLLPALALVIGTWFLARKFCEHPLRAGLAAATAPVFVLSSTSVMCDTMMLALWVWAIVFWISGLRAGSAAKLCAAALLISACELTKYFGMTLIPLLLVYSLVEKRRAGAWLAWLLIPVFALVLYQGITWRLYGRGLLFTAVSYATTLRVGGGLPVRILTGLAFSGWCILILIPLAPFLWGRRARIAGIIAVALMALLAVQMKKIDQFSIVGDGGIKWLFVAQFSCAIVAGASLMMLAVRDWLWHRTANASLLLLWVAGTFLFACAVNWTVSGRNILPMLPAAAILLVRRLEARKKMGHLWVPLGISLTVALLAGWADYRLAVSARDAATVIAQKSAPAHPWFEGHWGFQYYMEQWGGRPLDVDHHHLLPHEVVAMPMGNSFLVSLSPDHFEPWFTNRGDTLPWLATMNFGAGAGYYSALWGPLPFAFGPAPPDEYQVFRVK